MSIPIPDSLKELAVSATAIQSNLPTGYHGFASGILVFHPTAQPDEILIIQRAAHDSHPNEWEVPGGAVDDTDPTFLDGAARELMEEAGLQVVAWVGQVGLGQGAKPGDSDVAKRGGYEFTSSKGKKIIRFSVEAEVTSANVKLDPNEHQDYVWATKQDVERRATAERTLVFTAEGQRTVILEGFRLREQRRKVKE
jgi:8-oxo-dGTP pyrophosphatase MutT (NUDIX family)